MAGYDPIFYKRFNIKTHIEYIHDVVIEAGLEKIFYEKWDKFFKKHRTQLSPSRKKSFMRFISTIKKDGDDARYCDKFIIKYIDKVMGHGVFAKKSIPPYSILNHYAGIIRYDKEIELENDSVFAFRNFHGFSLDGSHSANWTRFINHGDLKSSGTNVISWELFLPEGPRIIFTASHRGIMQGEQLLFYYGDQYWK